MHVNLQTRSINIINTSTISTPWDSTGWPVAKGWMRVP